MGLFLCLALSNPLHRIELLGQTRRDQTKRDKPKSNTALALRKEMLLEMIIHRTRVHHSMCTIHQRKPYETLSPHDQIEFASALDHQLVKLGMFFRPVESVSKRLLAFLHLQTGPAIFFFFRKAPPHPLLLFIPHEVNLENTLCLDSVFRDSDCLRCRCSFAVDKFKILNI